MHVIDGRALAAQIREQLKKDIERSGFTPKLAVLLVGDDPASHLYVSLKEKTAQGVGIDTDIRRLPKTVSDEDLLSFIHTWNEDETVDGILVQLPLPDGHDTDAIIRAIDPRKDADGFHPQNLALFLAGRGRIIPPLHEGILRMIASTDIVMQGARATIIANSEVFSKPLEYLLRKAGAFTAILSPNDLDQPTLLTSQIVVIAIGAPHTLTQAHLAPHTVVIDVGITRLSDGKMVGDVDARSLKNLQGWITPVPGGIGPMTVALLLKNVFRLANYRHKQEHVP